MAERTATALIVDDEPDLLSLLAISLRRMDIKPVKATDVRSACKKLSTQSFDLCLTDLRLPDGSGLDVIKYVQQHQGDTPIAVITAFGDAETAVDALKNGAFDYVSKPIDIIVLQNLVETALKVKQADTPKSKSTVTRPLYGNSKAIENIRLMIEKVARNQAPVHITGETGTGKELIARLIHDQSPRSNSPFIAVNCGAIPRELMESEFFGHKKGSFTGAHQDTEGLFRAADGGTLFLDEVGDLPAELQVKLLRAIQEKKIRAIGETAETQTNIRLISATNKDLGTLIRSGEFREDFYYRINVIPIHASPLRELVDDIPILAEQIINRLAAENNLPIPKITDDALNRLRGYHFPGNIRELENILERALALLESDQIDADNLILPDATNTSVENDLSDLPIDEHVNQIEIERIQQALADSNGNITVAAKLLGTSFRSLRYRIKKLGIDVHLT